MVVTPLIWDTPSAGDLYKDTGRRLTASTYLTAHLLEATSTEDQLKQLPLWAQVTTRFLDFPSTAAHFWVSWTNCKSSQ